MMDQYHYLANLDKEHVAHPSPTERTLFRSRIAGLNLALDGGFRRGEATLIGGITGGGKTVLACQLAFEFGASGAKVALFSSESGADPLIPRFVANATSTQYARLTGGSSEDYWEVVQSLATDPRTKGAMAQLMHVLENNVWITKISDEDYCPMGQRLSGGLQNLQKHHITPDVLIYDWLGNIESVGTRDAFALRRRYKESADCFASFCATNGFAGIIFCQIAEYLIGNKTAAIRSSMVAEAKDMAEHMAHFIGISSLRDPDPRVLVNRQRRQYLCVESKTGRRQNVPVEQQFEFQRFAGVDGNL
jgi:hypothetical protein